MKKKIIISCIIIAFVVTIIIVCYVSTNITYTAINDIIDKTLNTKEYNWQITVEKNVPYESIIYYFFDNCIISIKENYSLYKRIWGSCRSQQL